MDNFHATLMIHIHMISLEMTKTVLIFPLWVYVILIIKISNVKIMDLLFSIK